MLRNSSAQELLKNGKGRIRYNWRETDGVPVLVLRADGRIPQMHHGTILAQLHLLNHLLKLPQQPNSLVLHRLQRNLHKLPQQLNSRLLNLQRLLLSLIHI